jgi:8-oxo-dGTP pyrophosphatase MutT (NUDIX family)
VPVPGSRGAPPARSAEGWVTCALGHRHWGRYGAAGLLLVAEGHVLLQLRAAWSHHGGTWGVPGGALAPDEASVDGALRECAEEAGIEVPPSAVAAQSVSAHGGWSYTTVLATADSTRRVRPTDAESDELRWVPLEEVPALPLHPGFAAAWPSVAEAAGRRLRVVVDAANVVGSRPDGWWRDRAGAAARLRDALGGLQVPAAELPPGTGLPQLDVWVPDVVLVVEGAARGVAARPGGPAVAAAGGSGDDEVVRQVAAARSGRAGQATVVVTSDRVLQGRARSAGGVPVGAGWLLRLLDGPPIGPGGATGPAPRGAGADGDG